ncbi:hypothetical protein C8Q79DRAFT_1011237 [Trametes meyenii]|nr:hypothetical protein C8Q79DRAFT_1011237 [Trametes meyenii]
MRAFDSVYEEPSFEEPSAKERGVFYAVVGAAVTIASTVAAIQLNGSPEWLSPAAAEVLLGYRPASITTPHDDHWIVLHMHLSSSSSASNALPSIYTPDAPGIAARFSHP